MRGRGTGPTGTSVGNEDEYRWKALGPPRGRISPEGGQREHPIPAIVDELPSLLFLNLSMTFTVSLYVLAVSLSVLAICLSVPVPNLS